MKKRNYSKFNLCTLNKYILIKTKHKKKKKK